jgi:Flp pilus assembly protein TadB
MDSPATPNPPPDTKPPGPESKLVEMTIHDRGRWTGLLAYLFLFALVAMVLIFMLTAMGAPLGVAIGAVVVMVIGMLVLAKLGSHDLNRRD